MKQTEEREPITGAYAHCELCLDGKFFEGPIRRIPAEAESWAMIHNLQHRRKHQNQ